MDMKTKVLHIRKILKKSKSPVIFFDSDCDGATSYLQLKHSFPQAVGYPMNKDFEHQRYLAKYVNDDNDIILFIDTPIINEELLDSLKSKRIIWVDHHPNDNERKIEKYDIFYLNPTTQNRTNLPGAYLAYLIANDKKNIVKAVLGSISDFFLLDILEELHTYNPQIFNLIINIDEKKREEIFEFIKINIKNHTVPQNNKRDEFIRYLIYETNISTLRDFIETVLRFKDDENTIKAIRELEKLDLDELLANINSEKGFIYEEYSRLERAYKDALKKALTTDHDNDIFFFEYSGERGFSGALSQEINYRTKAKVVCICFKKKAKDYYSCSIRGRETNVSDILEFAIKGLHASGGGHKFAVGASIHKSDFETFKNRIFEKAKEQQTNFTQQ